MRQIVTSCATKCDQLMRQIVTGFATDCDRICPSSLRENATDCDHQSIIAFITHVKSSERKMRQIVTTMRIL